MLYLDARCSISNVLHALLGNKTLDLEHPPVYLFKSSRLYLYTALYNTSKQVFIVKHENID